MELVLNEEQTMLDQTAKNFIKDNSPITRMRKLRDDGDPLCYSKEMWKKMAELGWTSILFSEEDGGMGLGMAEVILVTEAMGRGLAPEPFFSTVMLAGQAIALEGSQDLKEQWLGRLSRVKKFWLWPIRKKAAVMISLVSRPTQKRPQPTTF